MNRDIGKLPPQALDLESAVLGTMLIDTHAVITVFDTIKTEEVFYKEENKRIFSAMQTLFNRLGKLDMLLLTDELHKTGYLDAVGGAFAISQLTHNVVSSANIEQYCAILKQKHIARDIIKLGSELMTKGYDDTQDVFDLLDYTSQTLSQISDLNFNKKERTIAELVKDAIERADKVESMFNSGSSSITGIDTGFHGINKLNGGWQPTDLVILAARPGMGKTAFVLNTVYHCLRNNKKAAIFSLEMSAGQLVDRMLSSTAEIDQGKIKKGGKSTDEQNRFLAAAGELADYGLTIDDKAGISPFELRNKVRKIKAQNKGLDLIVVDYLQLMTGNSKTNNRTEEISQISRELKAIAKELEVPVIALSQLSRAVEQRGGDKKPMLSDLRESGSIEQDADMVGFLYRPEYYGKTEDDQGNSTEGLAQFIVAKNRHGGLNEVPLKFVGRFTKFLDINEFQETTKPINIQHDEEWINQNKPANSEEPAPF